MLVSPRANPTSVRSRVQVIHLFHMLLVAAMVLNEFFQFFVIAEVDMQKLSQALKILSDTEKQFRMSKNQTTWLTVALLQLSSMESFSSDANDLKLCFKDAQGQGEDCHDLLLLNIWLSLFTSAPLPGAWAGRWWPLVREIAGMKLSSPSLLLFECRW